MCTQHVKHTQLQVFAQRLRVRKREKLRVTQRVTVLYHRESQFSAQALILTVEFTLASTITREMAADCAAKRNTGMRAKGILTTEWWNNSKNVSVMYNTLEFHVCLYYQDVNVIAEGKETAQNSLSSIKTALFFSSCIYPNLNMCLYFFQA